LPKKTALITGVTGQDGAYLSELLLGKDYDVHGVKRRSSSFNSGRVDHLYRDPHETDVKFHMHYGDMTDSTNLIRIVQETQPDEIYNLAAQSHVQVSFETPEYTANADALGALRLLEAIRILKMEKTTRFYQASTSELFGKVREIPQKETTPFYPRSPYAAAKAYAYWITVNYREAYGMFACNGILFNHESPTRGETFVTRKITRAAAAIHLGLQDKLFIGNLDSKRDWGHARDYVEGMWRILQQNDPEDFVLATGEAHSVREFVGLAFAEMALAAVNLFKPYWSGLRVVAWLVRNLAKTAAFCWLFQSHLVRDITGLPPTPLPPNLSAEMRPYQKTGYDFLVHLTRHNLGGILADDMGLGKTVEALCVFDKKTLVVCPTSVLPNWKSELARFRPSLRVNVYHGPARQFDDSADVTLTTYAILRIDSEDLSRRRFDAAVIDEAQAIKNPDSQVARAAYALNADFRLAMTGTPVENRLDELWSLMHFANRGLLGGRREFDAEVARPVADGMPGAAQSLRQRIRPFVLRRRKAEVAPELPPRTEATLKIALDERERGIYDVVRAATQSDMVAALGAGGSGKLDVMKALEALLRLRQAACHPALLPGQKAASSSKVEALVEALVTAAEDGHKALVFSQWTSLLDLIEPVLSQIGIEFTRLDGSTRDRAAVVESFQATAGPPVMLISLKAGGTGLNLTAADHVFLCDPWWNPAVEDQAADRAHRIGQERPVMIYRLVAVDTVEERILELQQRKRAIGEAALGDAAAAASLTRDDLLALLA